VAATSGQDSATTAVPVRKQIAYSANQLGINLLWQAFNTVAVYFYVTDLKVSGVAISAGLVVYGFVNAFLNLAAGHISDRTRTRMGRRIPYVLFCTLPFGVTFFFLFAPPPGSTELLTIYFFALVFLFDLFFTFTALNVGALYPEMYQEKKSRARVSALQQMFTIVGLILGVALSKSLGQTLGWHAMAAIFGVIGVASLFVSLYGSFENPLYREQSSFHWKEAVVATFANRRFVMFVVADFLIQLCTTMLTTVAAFYTKYVVALSPLEYSIFFGSVFIVAIPVSFVWARVSVRLTAARAAFVATVLYTVTIAAFIVDASPLAVMLTGVCLGLSVSGFLVLLNILLAEVIDHDAVRTGRRREGMYLGVNGFLVRLGLSVQYGIMAIFFAVSGYNAHLAVQSASTVLGFRLLMGALPIVFLILALIFLARYVRQRDTAYPPATTEGS
jgi:GPH family glycoside/pentoside/hexuronide:cation symporter